MINLIAAAVFLCASPGVIDGDTLRCQDGTGVRVWGIQAPERHEPAGPAATRAMTNITRGVDLRCEPKGRSYERVVARCWTPAGRDIAAEMVDQGHAVDWPRYSGGEYAR
jgi:endonuclease YncB( thermonuclease family)